MLNNFQLIRYVYIQIGLTLLTYKKPPFIKVAIFSVKLSWLQRRDNKINSALFDIYYLQNCKNITFKKLNQTEDK